MSAPDKFQRTILPIPDKQHIGVTTYDAKDPDTKFPPIEQLRPPKGAPNVLIVLLDDVGFAASSAFGGPIHTPTAERLAKNGLKFNRFHTTALCSPTRQALLTGRNHHSVNMGGICEIATAAPGYSSVLPKNKAPLAMTLKLNGYSTAQFGKCHEVPVWETSPMGPFNQLADWRRRLRVLLRLHRRRNQSVVPGDLRRHDRQSSREKTPEEGYHFTEDMTNKAIKWTRQQKALMPDKPFFMYFAPGACHAPHHVPKDWIEKYKGKFDQGWDKLREETFARQKKLGVIPADAVLTARPDEIPAWDKTPENMRPIFAREMEVYAAFLEHTDHHLGRLIDSLKDLEILDDTLIYLIIGDNGASAEGTPNGCFNEMATLNGLAAVETPEFLASKIDLFGGAGSLQPLRGRLGTRDGYALSVDQAGGVALGRHPQRHDRALAKRHQGEGRSPQPVPSRHRRRADDPRGRRHTASDDRQQRAAGAASKASACSTRSTTPRPRSGTRRSTSRCSATAASTTRGGRR